MDPTERPRVDIRDVAVQSESAKLARPADRIVHLEAKVCRSVCAGCERNGIPHAGIETFWQRNRKSGLLNWGIVEDRSVRAEIFGKRKRVDVDAEHFRVIHALFCFFDLRRLASSKAGHGAT